MPATHIMANELIDYIRTNYASLWVCAYTVLPTKAGGGTEPVGGSYARIELDMDALFPAAGSSETENDTLVSFAAATGSWGNIVGYGLNDASTSGDVLFWFERDTPIAINSGDVLAFPIGNIKIRNV